MCEGALQLPPGYYLEYDSDILLVVRRIDSSLVAAFSAHDVEPKEIQKTAEEDAHQRLSLNKGAASSLGAVSDRARLWVRFLGGFEVTCCCGAVLQGSNAKALAIFKYLLTHKPSSVSQHYLMGWLWPDVNSDRARWSLNSAVRALREVLDNCSRLAHNAVALVCEDGCYHLSSTIEVLTDVDEFDAYYKRGRRLQKEGWTDEAITEYEKALERYQGDYLVEDLYEDWTMIERERLASVYMDILGRLANYYLEERKQPQESIWACYKLLKKDPCHEEAYRLLMRCYVRLRLRSRALDQYRICRHMLGSVHGMEPSLELQAVCDSVKRTAISDED